MAYDRFRTDVSWEEQLRASEAFLKLLAPTACDLGIHTNLETHEEITSFEVVRLVEAVGPDVMGVTFDVGNVVQRGESPLMAAQRVAPYVRQTHMKDIVLTLAPGGLRKQMRPCGQGLIDFQNILPLLAQHRPELNLSIENPNVRNLVTMRFFDPLWHASHTDLSTAELADLVRLTSECERRIGSGDWLDLDAYHQQTFGYAEEVAFIQESAAYLRGILGTIGPSRGSDRTDQPVGAHARS